MHISEFQALFFGEFGFGKQEVIPQGHWLFKSYFVIVYGEYVEVSPNSMRFVLNLGNDVAIKIGEISDQRAKNARNDEIMERRWLWSEFLWDMDLITGGKDGVWVNGQGSCEGNEKLLINKIE